MGRDVTEQPKAPGLLSGQNAVAVLGVAVLALVALLKASDLDYGSLAEIGPGLFPTALAVILLGLCMCLAVTSWRGSGHAELVGALNWRAVSCIIGALCVFAVSIRGVPPVVPALGVVGATPLAVMLAGLADPETRWVQLAVFAATLTAFCTLLFRFLLGLPLPVAPFILGY